MIPDYAEIRVDYGNDSFSDIPPVNIQGTDWLVTHKGTPKPTEDDDGNPIYDATNIVFGNYQPVDPDSCYLKITCYENDYPIFVDPEVELLCGVNLEVNVVEKVWSTGFVDPPSLEDLQKYITKVDEQVDCKVVDRTVTQTSWRKAKTLQWDRSFLVVIGIEPYQAANIPHTHVRIPKFNEHLGKTRLMLVKDIESVPKTGYEFQFSVYPDRSFLYRGVPIYAP